MRNSRFTSQPDSRKSTASQSSNSWLTGDFPVDAEILGGLHQPGAEDLLPEAVHRHAGGERMLGPQQPLGETEAVPRQLGRHGRKERGRRRLDFFPPLVVIAAEEHVGLGRLGALLHHVGHGAAGADRQLLLLGLGQLRRQVLIRLVLAAEPEVEQLVALGLAPLGGRLRQDRRQAA